MGRWVPDMLSACRGGARPCVLSQSLGSRSRRPRWVGRRRRGARRDARRLGRGGKPEGGWGGCRSALACAFPRTDLSCLGSSHCIGPSEACSLLFQELCGCRYRSPCLSICIVLMVSIWFGVVWQSARMSRQSLSFGHKCMIPSVVRYWGGVLAPAKLSCISHPSRRSGFGHERRNTCDLGSVPLCLSLAFAHMWSGRSVRQALCRRCSSRIWPLADCRAFDEPVHSGRGRCRHRDYVYGAL